MATEIGHFNPYLDAKAFRNQYATPREAWEACPRGDWMLWIS